MFNLDQLIRDGEERVEKAREKLKEAAIQVSGASEVVRAHVLSHWEAELAEAEGILATFRREKELRE
ncbi:hypothetical protein BIU82_00185 [Arthrobacter sp. SW1]|uniref:hypothetical protein n=1 Tax=Arthrobacter sp. SW1 TaxID=1920889 RepID=UPI000877D630|nr:hypothetical protein [Arthrobacter sp. SW1]OFI39535.1 hypothetical protein BIU82_00185 [Arthrobacter sp. SW1]